MGRGKRGGPVAENSSQCRVERGEACGTSANEKRGGRALFSHSGEGRPRRILESGPMRSEAGPSSANQQAEFYLGTVTGAGRRRS